MFEDMFDMDTVALDIEGDAQQMALAWASAAHGVAGPYWPAAFGYVAAQTPAPQPQYDIMGWLQDIGRRADFLVDSLVGLEREAGLGTIYPRFPAWYESQAGLFLTWDTSVSLILGPGSCPAHLRLVLLGAHDVRERLAREALANKES